MRRRHLRGLALGLLLVASARAEGPPTTDESLAAFRLADPDLKVELVAAEPLVTGPVAIAWDDEERLFVVEMTDYPVGPPSGRIKRLDDLDGDGRYDRATVFAENLPYPTGLLPWRGGLLVTSAPNLLFLKDADGDGRADERRVVLTGFHEGNQQLRVNSPTYGIDNWVYLANGRSGGAVRRPEDPAAKAVAIPRNDLRLRPDTGEFEPISGFSQFGLPRDDWGRRFPSWNTVPIRHAVLEARDLAADTGAAALGTQAVADILDLSDGGRIFSLAPSQRRFNGETVAFFNATCGPTIYRGDGLGPSYAGHAFICEPLTSVVHHRRLDPAGPTFVARRVEPDREFLASTHSWFRPVNLATGPDGALYVVDFCRAWVEHPAFVPEGQRNAVDFREGADRGRLWRIVPRKPAPVAPAVAISLVRLLEDPNGWRRDTTQRLLVERQDAVEVPALRRLVKESSVPVARAHALWTLDGLRALDLDILKIACRDTSEGVREQAARLAEPRADELAAELIKLVADPSESVRLRAAVALRRVDSDPARAALATYAARDVDSPWATGVVLAGAGVDPVRLLAALAAADPSWTGGTNAAQSRFLEKLGRVVGVRDDAEAIASLTDLAAAAPDRTAALALLGGLARGRALAHAAFRIDPAVAAEARRVLGDQAAPAWRRRLALDLLVETGAKLPAESWLALLDPTQPAEIQSAAAQAVGRVETGGLFDRLFARWGTLTLAARRVVLGSLASRASTAGRLLDAVEAGDVSPQEIEPSLRDALGRVGGDALKARAAEVLRTPPAEDRAAVVRRYTEALSQPGEVGKGRALFEKHCQTCHARNGRGARVGPDLIGAAGRPAGDLLVSVLDPSREAAPDGRAVVVATRDGRTLTGLLAEETPVALRLRRAEGVEDLVPRADVASLTPTNRSLMPDGLEQTLSVADLADLLAFLRSPAGP